MSNTQTLLGAGPDVLRSISTPYPEPQLPPTDLESRAAEIKARQRVDDERRYRELVFAYRERALGDDETVEITGLADKLGLTPRVIEAHASAIRQAESAEKILAERDPDIPALEAEAKKSNAAAVEALAESIADFFRGKSIETVARARDTIRANCPWLQPHPGIPFDLMPKLPDRNCRELADEAARAKSAIESAVARKPNAAATLRRIRAENPLIWPEE
jgi:hypothetical protein